MTGVLNRQTLQECCVQRNQSSTWFVEYPGRRSPEEYRPAGRQSTVEVTSGENLMSVYVSQQDGSQTNGTLLTGVDVSAESPESPYLFCKSH